MTKEQVLKLFGERQSIWLTNSVSIANCFPHIWEAFEHHFAKTRNMLNLRLTDLQIDIYTEQVEYSIMEHERSISLKQTVPLALLVQVESSEDPAIVEYLEKNPPSEIVDVDETADEQQARRGLEQALMAAQRQYPGMFLDVARMVELETQFKLGNVFRGPTTDTMQ